MSPEHQLAVVYNIYSWSKVKGIVLQAPESIRHNSIVYKSINPGQDFTKKGFSKYFLGHRFRFYPETFDPQA
jgi:hypothetical protein